jgi:hypothetical protein
MGAGRQQKSHKHEKIQKAAMRQQSFPLRSGGYAEAVFNPKSKIENLKS